MTATPDELVVDVPERPLTKREKAGRHARLVEHRGRVTVKRVASA